MVNDEVKILLVYSFVIQTIMDTHYLKLDQPPVPTIKLVCTISTGFLTFT